MKSRRLNFITCECKVPVSVRSLMRHLRSKTDSHSKNFIEKCQKTININKTKPWAWKISEGIDGKLDHDWCAKVLNGELQLEDLTFDSPRPRGQCTPDACKKSSISRKGKNNPSLRNKPIYDNQQLKLFAIQVFQNLLEDPQKFLKLDLELNKKFPDYRYGFADMFTEHAKFRGDNKRNKIFSYLIDKPIEWVVSEKAKDRGKFISLGQRKSSKFNKIQNAGKKTLRGHVTVPHNTLFNMILSVDKNAKKEKQVDYGSTWKSYDIFSPKLNALIEMHGHVWHDWHKCKASMLPLVIKNVKNDIVKSLLAEKIGCNLIVFWDDQTDKWEEQIEKLYGKQPKSYEQALREEIDKKGDR